MSVQDVTVFLPFVNWGLSHDGHKKVQPHPSQNRPNDNAEGESSTNFTYEQVPSS